MDGWPTLLPVGAWASGHIPGARSSGGFSADRAKQNRERRQPAHLMAVVAADVRRRRDLALIRIRLPTVDGYRLSVFILSMRLSGSGQPFRR